MGRACGIVTTYRSADRTWGIGRGAGGTGGLGLEIARLVVHNRLEWKGD